MSTLEITTPTGGKSLPVTAVDASGTWNPIAVVKNYAGKPLRVRFAVTVSALLTGFKLTASVTHGGNVSALASPGKSRCRSKTVARPRATLFPAA